METGEPVKPTGEEITIEGGYPDFKKVTYYTVNGYLYNSKALFDTYWEDMLQKRSTCKELAEKVKKCKELEQTGALIYGYFSVSQESVNATKDSISNAEDITDTMGEENMMEAASELKSFNEELADLSSNFNEPMSTLQNINTQLNEMHPIE